MKKRIIQILFIWGIFLGFLLTAQSTLALHGGVAYVQGAGCGYVGGFVPVRPAGCWHGCSGHLHGWYGDNYYWDRPACGYGHGPGSAVFRGGYHAGYFNRGRSYWGPPLWRSH